VPRAGTGDALTFLAWSLASVAALVAPVLLLAVALVGIL
jgi:hypothetical protein